LPHGGGRPKKKKDTQTGDTEVVRPKKKKKNLAEGTGSILDFRRRLSPTGGGI